MVLSKDIIKIDPREECEKIIEKLKTNVFNSFKKRGTVIGISGGIDSSVVFALCVKAFGKERVLGVMMPEKDSNSESENLARQLANKFDTQYVVENITNTLKGFRCYERRDEAVKRIFPEYNNESYKIKIFLPPSNMEKDTLNLFHIKMISSSGEEKVARLPLREYLEIVAASNFKQRCRMSMLYYHAESRNYAVIGTANKNEHELGFFVKYGDGGADIKPIANYFKTQVYQLAEYLEIPVEIRNRIPTTDTYSAEQTQEEFFFKIPFKILDRIWISYEKNKSIKEIAEMLELSEEQVENVIYDIQRKVRTTEYLRSEPL